jgi:hypothetical protein
MGATEKVLLTLLLLALATFPVAVVLYLRTAYRQGGWKQVRTAAGLAAAVVLIYGVGKLWFDWEISNLLRVLEHPFAIGSILFVLLMWLGHWVLTMQNEETNDHH